MIDLEKGLRELGAKKSEPSEELKRHTRTIVKNAFIEKTNKPSKTNPVRRYVPIFATVLAVVLVFILLPTKITNVQENSYYTIDINPSISVEVDTNDKVLSVSPENDDAIKLLRGIDLKGIQFIDALKIIIAAADEKDFIKEDGHVLVAHFGAQEGITQDELSDIVSELSDISIKVLLISGDKDSYENAHDADKKAGIELLKAQAEAMGIYDDNLDDIIDLLKNKNDIESKSDDDKKDSDSLDVNREYEPNDDDTPEQDIDDTHEEEKDDDMQDDNDDDDKLDDGDDVKDHVDGDDDTQDDNDDNDIQDDGDNDDDDGDGGEEDGNDDDGDDGEEDGEDDDDYNY